MIVTPNRNKVVILVIVFLLLANIGMAVLMFAGRGREKAGSRKNQMESYLKDELNFSPQQLSSYDSLHDQYEKSLESQMEAMRSSRKERFRILTEADFSDSAISEASRMMATRQQENEAGMLRHLRNIRNIGNAQQREIFDSTFFVKMARKRKMKQQ